VVAFRMLNNMSPGSCASGYDSNFFTDKHFTAFTTITLCQIPIVSGENGAAARAAVWTRRWILVAYRGVGSLFFPFSILPIPAFLSVSLPWLVRMLTFWDLTGCVILICCCEYYIVCIYTVLVETSNKVIHMRILVFFHISIIFK